MLTNEQLREIEARLEAATPGPWKWNKELPSLVLENTQEDYVIFLGVWDDLCISEPDATLVAHARTDIRALLDEVRELQRDSRELDAALAEIERLRNGLGLLRKELTEARCALSESEAAHEFYEDILEDILEEVCGGDLG